MYIKNAINEAFVTNSNFFYSVIASCHGHRGRWTREIFKTMPALMSSKNDKNMYLLNCHRCVHCQNYNIDLPYFDCHRCVQCQNYNIDLPQYVYTLSKVLYLLHAVLALVIYTGKSTYLQYIYPYTVFALCVKSLQDETANISFT